MDGKRLITSLHLRNLLSFGPDSGEIPLEPLNVLIGPNASGKSNVIEAISLLHAAPRDLQALIREGGGVKEWLWKGGDSDRAAEIEAVIAYPNGTMDLRYRLVFALLGQRFEIIDEAIENERPNRGQDVPYFYYRYQDGHPVLNVQSVDGEEDAGSSHKRGRVERRLRREDLNPEQSVLSQRKDPDQYPEVTYLIEQYGRVRIFGEWHLGRRTEPRRPQPTDLPSDFLGEDASNLALVVNNLQNYSEVEESFNEHLRRFYPRARRVTATIEGNTVQLGLHEDGLSESIPATRLSDGTLRYLCLLTVLLHPKPPPLVCIEEPELGLHPDIMPTLAELMVDASQRMQLIVTTHSEALVSALSSVPEAVAICERGEDGGTVIRRLEEESLREWLDRYTLGDLWAMGELGGVL